MNNTTLHNGTYDLKSVKMPYLSGFALRLFAEIMDMVPYPTTVSIAWMCV